MMESPSHVFSPSVLWKKNRLISPNFSKSALNTSCRLKFKKKQPFTEAYQSHGISPSLYWGLVIPPFTENPFKVCLLTLTIGVDGHLLMKPRIQKKYVPGNAVCPFWGWWIVTSKLGIERSRLESPGSWFHSKHIHQNSRFQSLWGLLGLLCFPLPQRPGNALAARWQPSWVTLKGNCDK